jgi:hypothetical protein
MIPPSTYQGFTGSNYAEDDAERAKAGGIVAGFGRGLPGQPLQQEQSRAMPSQASIDPPEYNQLDTLRNNIIHRQNILDAIIDHARQDPRFAHDMDNNTTFYLNDFKKQYPQHEQLSAEMQDMSKKYMEHPMSQQHLQDRLQKTKEIEMPEFMEDTGNFRKLKQRLK